MKPAVLPRTLLWVEKAAEETRVLCVHAPYPGRLKFDGGPSSLLYAAGVLARCMADAGRLSELGVLDPRESSREFYDELEHLASRGSIELVLLSTSTAAIEEAAWVARVLRETAGEELLIVGGGPHEDDCPEKMAAVLPEVDLSVAGDGEDVVDEIAWAWLERGRVGKREFLAGLPGRAGEWGPTIRGSAVLTSASYQCALGGTTIAPPTGPEGRAWLNRPTRFSVFEAEETLPLMVSRGCSYGACSFCAEGNGGKGQRTAADFTPVSMLHEARPRAALYFQDSIFPHTRNVETKLLPLLQALGIEWGCQVYLKTVSRAWLTQLAKSGCRYIYTGLESASTDILQAVGKQGLSASVTLERLKWARDLGLSVGISLMFGAMTETGELLETSTTVDETLALAHAIKDSGVRVAGYYPNVFTLLPGTDVARGIERSRGRVDFYRVPRSHEFEGFEDGAFGHNFLNIADAGDRHSRTALAERIASAARELISLGTWEW